MPYIQQFRREQLDAGARPITPGELNFKITELVDDYLGHDNREVSYLKLNDAIGALEAAKLELYRRVAAPYEDNKMMENGDVYTAR